MSLLDRAFNSLFRFFGASSEREKLVLVLALGTALGYLASLVIAFQYHAWIVDGQGRPLLRDFLAFWAAGREALAGVGRAAYDPRLQHAAEVAAAGYRFSNGLGWSYPPLFLFAAAALAILPYALAFVLWGAATSGLYAAVVARIARDPRAFVFAFIAPWTLLCLWVGQNGFLTASLIGLALAFLEERPLVAGLMLGLLSYKPQFGVLFPLALAAGGYWRAFIAAAISVLLLNGIAALVFGPDTLRHFFSGLGYAAETHLNGGIVWKKLQSPYGLMRAAGLAGGAAMVVQVVAGLAIAVGVIFSWRSRLPYALKAATLATASVMSTPYVFAYDLPVLAIGIAFLYQHHHFTGREWLVLAVGALLTFLFLAVPWPTAFAATLLVALLIVQRVRLTSRV